jgi:hypothetical protein
VFVGLFFAVEQRRTQAETDAMLSAFFSQEVLNDKWDAGRAITIVVINNKEDQVGRTIASTASPVHKGGAYGDGTAESGVGFGCGAARTARELSQLVLSAGSAGASGQDYFVVRFLLRSRGADALHYGPTSFKTATLRSSLAIMR